MYYLNAFCLIHILPYTQNIWAVGFRSLLKQMNFLLSWMCVYMTSIMMSWHAYCKWVAWVVFMEAILSCLNIKPDNGCLPYSMPETSKKTGHGLTDIIIAWAEFNQLFFENGLLSTRGEMKDVHHGWGPCQKSL